MDKIKVLFLNQAFGGVNYFRTETPAIQLKNDYSDDFEITVKNKLTNTNSEDVFNDLKEYDIIHYHRTILNNLEDNNKILKNLKEFGVTLIMDIDDYWDLDKTNQLYNYAIKNRIKELTIDNIANCDHVTTTTDFFKEEIKKYSENVTVLPNSINPTIQPQFKNNNNFDRDIVTITYIGGSSHLEDIKLLDGVVNILNSDTAVRGKFRILLGGFDINGFTTEKVLNEDFVKAMKLLNLYNNDFILKLKKYNADITKIKEIPDQLKEVFKDRVIIERKRDIKPNESVYYQYEKILTDNYKLIGENREYFNYLHQFKREKYIKEIDVNYVRRWTEKPHKYANILDETDILIAPLKQTLFNNFKSNLKQVEAITRKLPIICSDVVPYNIDGNSSNCILIGDKKNQDREWAKHLKFLILNPEERKKLGENLYNDMTEKYSLINTTKQRASLYKEIMKKHVYDI